MPSRSSLVLSRRNRRISERRARTSGVKRAGLGVGLILSILLIAGLVLGALAYADLTRGLPNVGILPALLNPLDGTLLRPTRLYDRTGKHLLFTFEPAAGGASTTAGGANIQSPAGTASAAPVLRRYLPLSASSPQHLPDFLAKATVVINDPGFWSHGGYTLAGMGDPGAHPTIAQKLVSDLLLYGEPPTLRRALRERILAAQLTAQYGRSQVLEWYLNSADYGNYAYGADAAAQLYFGKPATELTPAESAALAAASQAPGLNPLDAPALASQRGRTVVGLMKDFRVISAAEAQQALSGELSTSSKGVPAHQRTFGSDYPLFTALALDQLSPAFTRDRITRGGLDIITTMDYDLQDGVQTQLAESGEGRSMASVILDPQTGQILAATGETVRGEESANLAPHDPGTLLTPFRYLTAFTRGFSPASLVWDIPSSASMAEPAA
ncbi:MAG TPA: transglycosylase domain-containing protein, partial [Anaerolineales bacterium]|nr:transglycosylase domain-containing protein [Anaerolineales bacterium]